MRKEYNCNIFYVKIRLPLPRKAKTVQNFELFNFQFLTYKEISRIDQLRVQSFFWRLYYLENVSLILQEFTTDLTSIGLKNINGYDLMDLWSGTKMGHFQPSNVFTVRLAPTSVVFYKATLTILPNKKHQKHFINF